MTYRPAASLVFAIVLIASVCLKLPGLTTLTATAANRIPPEIESLLAQHRFEVSEFVPDNDLTWITGVAGDCRVRIAAVAPQGWHRSLIAQVAAGNRLSYLFEGKVYPEQPILRTRLYHYWTKLYRYFGIDPKAAPVLAVISAPACRNVPLQEIAATAED